VQRRANTGNIVDLVFPCLDLTKSAEKKGKCCMDIMGL